MHIPYHMCQPQSASSRCIFLRSPYRTPGPYNYHCLRHGCSQPTLDKLTPSAVTLYRTATFLFDEENNQRVCREMSLIQSVAGATSNDIDQAVLLVGIGVSWPRFRNYLLIEGDVKL